VSRPNGLADQAARKPFCHRQGGFKRVSQSLTSLKALQPTQTIIADKSDERLWQPGQPPNQ
jgi:hypothetical protein